MTRMVIIGIVWLFIVFIDYEMAFTAVFNNPYGYSQPAFPCSKSTMEIPKQCVKSVQS